MKRKIKVTGLEIFMSGIWNDREYADEFIDLLAETYDPVNEFKAPHVFGHEGLFLPANEPSQGWIDKVYAITREIKGKEHRVLMCDGEIGEDLLNGIISGEYLNRSIFLTRDYRGTGKPYLLHCGWLGAAEPAVKGLSNDFKIEIFSKLKDKELEIFNNVQENIELIAVESEAFNLDGLNYSDLTGDKDKFKFFLKGGKEMTPEELKKFQQQMQELTEKFKSVESSNEKLAAENKNLKEQLCLKESEVDKLQAEQKIAECGAFVNELVKDGKLSPGLAQGLDKFIASLSETKKEKFSTAADAAAEISQQEFFKQFLSGLVKVVTFKQIATKSESAKNNDSDESLATKVRKFAKENGIAKMSEAFSLYLREHQDEQYSSVDTAKQNSKNLNAY